MNYTYSDELCHYGVLGMKWGVRRGHYADSYAKGIRKIKKLEAKSDKAMARYTSGRAIKARAKAANLRRRSERLEYKSNRLLPTLFRKHKHRKALALAARASRIESRQARMKFKMQNNARKAEKFYQKMEKIYKDVPVSKLNKEDVSYGQQYAKTILERQKMREAMRTPGF